MRGERFFAARRSFGVWSTSRRGGGSPTYLISVTGHSGGEAAVGQELTASAGGWSGAPPSSLAWQWFADGAPIDGETAASYTPVEGDAGTVLSVRVTPSETYGAKSSAGYPVAAAGPDTYTADSTNVTADSTLHTMDEAA